MTGCIGVIGAGGASIADAGTVQITQVGNFVSTTQGVQIDQDLTGDTIDDSPKFRARETTYRATFGVELYRSSISAFSILPVIGRATYSTSTFTYQVFVNNGSTFTNKATSAVSAGSPNTLSTFFPVQFTDARINAGQETNGLIEVVATSTSKTDHVVEIIRLVFDDESTAEPEDATLGGTKPEFDPNPPVTVANDPGDAGLQALKTQLQKKIKKLEKKAKKAKKRGQKGKAKKFKKKIKKLKKRLASL